MQTLALMAVFVAIVIGIALGVYWLFWCLWTWVFMQLWPTGPQAIINPDYWVFVGMIFLVSFIGGLLFGRSDK